MYVTAELNVRAVRADLAAALRRAEAGQRLVITVGGRPVAQLGPVEAPNDSQPTLADLGARGLVVPARRGDRPAPDLIVSLPVGTRLDRLLGEIR